MTMHKNNIPPSVPEGIPAHLTHLTPMERSVWMLATVEQFSVSDIGEITGLSASETEEVLALARQKIQPLPLSVVSGWKRYAGWIRSAAAVFLALMIAVFWFKANRGVEPTNQGMAIQVPVNSGSGEIKSSPSTGTSVQPSPRNTAVVSQKFTQTAPSAVTNPVKRPADAVVVIEPMPFSPVVPVLEPMVTPIREKVAVLPALPLCTVSEVVSVHPRVVDLGKPQEVGASMALNLEFRTLLRLREALTPRSLVLPDEGFKISALMPSLFSSAH